MERFATGNPIRQHRRQTSLGSAHKESSLSHDWSAAIRPLHHPPKVKRVIWLTMAGGPSQLETFDFKPKLAQMDGQPMPASLTSGQQLAQLQGEKLVCLGPQM